MPAIGPTATLTLWVAGALLIYLECIRPGWVLPGAAGSVFVLLATARLANLGIHAPALAIAAAGAALLLAEAVFRWPGIPGAAGAVVLAFALTRLTPERPIAWLAAIPLAVLFSAVTVILASLAWQGYWAKRLG
ncbi:MAG: hypothetical protein R2729_00870 [Bryobacteraceae bacterium]